MLARKCQLREPRRVLLWLDDSRLEPVSLSFRALIHMIWKAKVSVSGSWVAKDPWCFC